ncbi:hypothetical protein Tfer_2882 [Thermincola ferriacetica]|uniref:Cytochrome c-type biogenesis protein H TPR domain-containing protein n=1 Tax=Thermincola ferriacetica TaxID=281456 RepID=A0A0L6VZI4_9FIRM|nr:hypothetical protein Tfer_2882 [Thermincola ferriacetica]
MAAVNQESAAKDVVSIKVAILIIILSVIVFIGTGLLIGHMYFWDGGNPVSKLDIDYRRGIAQVEQNPDDPQAHIDLGWVYMQKKQYTLAEREYLAALNLDRNNISAQYNLALLKIQVGKIDEAKKILEQIKRKRPEDLKARATLGYVYAEKGLYEKALAEFRLVEKYYPTNADLMFQFGRVYEKQGDDAQAREYYNRALKFDPHMDKAKEALKKL